MVTMLLLDYQANNNIAFFPKQVGVGYYQANSWNEICTLYHFVIWFSFLVSYSMQVRLMVGLLKSVGTGDLTTADGLVLCSSTPSAFFAFVIHGRCI